MLGLQVQIIAQFRFAAAPKYSTLYERQILKKTNPHRWLVAQALWIRSARCVFDDVRFNLSISYFCKTLTYFLNISKLGMHLEELTSKMNLGRRRIPSRYPLQSIAPFDHQFLPLDLVFCRDKAENPFLWAISKMNRLKDWIIFFQGLCLRLSGSIV